MEQWHDPENAILGGKPESLRVMPNFCQDLRLRALHRLGLTG